MDIPSAFLQFRNRWMNTTETKTEEETVKTPMAKNDALVATPNINNDFETIVINSYDHVNISTNPNPMNMINEPNDIDSDEMDLELIDQIAGCGEMQKIFGNDIPNELCDEKEGDDGDDAELPTFASINGASGKSLRFGKQHTSRREIGGFNSIYSSFYEKNYQKQTAMEKKEDMNALFDIEDDNIDLTKPLPKPFDNGCWNKLRFYLESFLVVHARMYALYLLSYQIGTRGLVIFDMYTDIIITYELYKGSEKVWFMLSSLFIVLPFVLVWSASLRFIQNYIEKIFYTLYTKQCVKILVNIGLILYMFPPLGSLFIALFEVYWVLTDILKYIKAFIFGTGLIEAADRETQAMKTYRKAIEMFAESIPQTLLQTYIFIKLTYVHSADKDYGINIQDLYLSISVSLLNLLVNFREFNREAKLHGMLFGEYALSVLQLAEVPIAKFVPRLGGIKKGYVEKVNFCGFKFDKASVTPLLEALHSDNCKLKTLKISIGSLCNLDLSSCKMLGYLLRNARNGAGIKVIISRVSSLFEVKQLFERFDKNKSGWLDEDEFLTALKELKCPIHHASIKKQKRMFQQLAIRRHTKRDRFYFYDFFHKTADIQCEDKKHWQFDFDMTQIDYPLHFIFQRIKQSIDKIVVNGHNKCVDKGEEKRMMANMSKLFRFCEGFNILNKIDETLKQHVFYIIIDALYSIDCIDDDKKSMIVNYEKLIWLLFLNLLENPTFDTEFFLNRNNIFQNDIKTERVKLLKANEFIRKLDDEYEETGYNIFEYCFLYKDNKDIQRSKCRAFVYLFDAFLKCILDDIQLNGGNSNYLKELISDGGELNVLFKGSNGFHIKDNKDQTPLYYAVRNGQDVVVGFFAEYIMMKKPSISSISPGSVLSQNNSEFDEEEKKNECKINWIENQDYLHSILHAAFLTKSSNPNPDILRLLLSTHKININYYCSMYGGYLGHHILRYRAGNNQKDKKYLLKCIQFLNHYGYDFVNNTDIPSKNNVLHYAVLLDDIEAMDMIINMHKQQNQNGKLSVLLNSRNNQQKMAIDIAMDLGKSGIVELLLNYDEQQIDFVSEYYSHYASKEEQEKSKGSKWINCFSELISKGKGKILNRIDTESKRLLLNSTKTLFESLDNQYETPGGPQITNDGNNYNSDLCDSLETILLHLHKDLGVAMTKKTKIKRNPMLSAVDLAILQ